MSQKQKPINAIIVRLKTKLFSNSREDKPISAEVRASKKLSIGAGKWVKYKLPKASLVELSKFTAAAHNWHREQTLAWENGSRLLSTKNLEKHNAWSVAQNVEFRKLVDGFVKNYPANIAVAKTMHAGTFRAEDYPAETEIRSHFIFTVEHEPIPSAEYFALAGIGEQVILSMQTELESRTQQKVGEAMNEAWNRMLQPLRALVEKMRDKKPVFHDTLVANITETLDLIPALNLTASQELLSAASQIREAMKGIDADTLRESLKSRNTASSAAQALINQFGKMGQRKFS